MVRNSPLIIPDKRSSLRTQYSQSCILTHSALDKWQFLSLVNFSAVKEKHIMKDSKTDTRFSGRTSWKILIIEPTRCTNFSNLFLEKIYMFRTGPLSIIRSFSLNTQELYMSYRFADSLRAGSGRNQFLPGPARKLSAKLYDIYHWCVYSEKLLMMDRGTVRNM